MLNDLLNRIPESVSLDQLYLVFAVIMWWGLVLLTCIVTLPTGSHNRRRESRPGLKNLED